MATTHENIGSERKRNELKPQDNSESVNPNRSSSHNNIDKGENQVSNGTQSTPVAPGIAKVGNTGAENNE
jgi:hypothetical protein